MDAIAQFKENQKLAWANFATLESVTVTAAPSLVRYAGITAGATVLDVACGTGVVALTAARLGARVTGIDLTPELVARAKEHAALANLEAIFEQGDAEALPLPDASFDVVVSQFGHIFAPRPDVAIKEMLRVLKPGGTIAFSTWPPELMNGAMFKLLGKYGPPPPEGVSPPVQWGDTSLVQQRLGDAVTNLVFSRDAIFFPTLSPQHFRHHCEHNLGPAKKLFALLDANDPAKAAACRRELEETAAIYFHENRVRQDFLMTRATKRST
jgi:SAM-dependent methyltransferase